MISFIETDGNEKIRGEKMLRLWYAKTYAQARWCQRRNQKGKSQSISEIPCVVPKSPALFWYPLLYSEIPCVILVVLCSTMNNWDMSNLPYKSNRNLYSCQN